MKDWFPHLVYGLALALMIGWILAIGRPVILPLVAGLIVAYVILGLAELFGRVPGLPASLRYGLAVLVIGLILVAIVWLVVTNVSEIAATLPRYQERVLALLQSVAIKFGYDGEPDWQAIRTEILARVDMRRAVGVTVATASSIAATFLVVVIYAGFILSEKDSFGQKIALLSSEPAKVAQIQQVIRDINSSIGSYLVLKTIINVVLGVGSYFIMLWFDIPFAGFWAILIGLFNYIPYIGGFLGVGLPAFLAVAELGAFWPFVSFLLAMIAIQVLLGNFIEPFMMGNSLNLSPLVILVSLVAWAALWGIAGAILSVPITAMMVIIFSEFPGTRPLAILMSKDGTLMKAGAAR